MVLLHFKTPRKLIVQLNRWDSYDNAMAETINGLYKAEVIHRKGPWRNIQALEMATLEWVDWFNHRRLLGVSSRNGN